MVINMVVLELVCEGLGVMLFNLFLVLFGGMKDIMVWFFDVFIIYNISFVLLFGCQLFEFVWQFMDYVEIIMLFDEYFEFV